ncbi:glycine--tRNA ligase subunit beta [Solimicrobium silvestre]|uniref:Glycine--tRNA ligase beta subunit n=1 Tax=Solimicrobium silvestre TaxID=2099400 RepID=A0A2S9H1E3_9BURK|nr:glycine--tRNA ligase subunit beta [Solimicrobium silvestre]PRC93763.1 glyS: glycine--tRNA ligase, beta subunit [Solimicrobium silvestre]
MNQILLVELFTEELPPKALLKLGEAFAAGIVNSLKSRDFLEADSIATSYATPRRLAVSITKVRATSPDQQCREKVLPVSVALDANGNASAPLLKKLAAMGFADVQISQLERAPDGKAESFFYSHTAPGLTLQTGLQSALEESIAKLPVPKLMTYQRPDGTVVQFARPVHRLVALHGEQVVDVTLFGLNSGRTTQGHRFLSEGNITLAHADNYADDLLNKGKVIASFDQRKEKIRAELLAQAGADQVLMPESLLDEVNALVEWPVVYNCHFEEKFLSVPQECLILTMQTNQKYFALTDAAGKLRPRFLIVSNIATDTPQQIIRGNETVVRPRLSDAKFFFEQDQKKTLAERASGLANVIYHNKLGNQAQRVERVQALAAYIATQLSADVTLAKRAAQLAKADLLTDMVGEFPELQGIMGSYYARIDGEDAQVALAMTEHYQPRFAGDELPSSVTGTILALADKLETLVGIWGIGLQPTGDRDPFALRRHALGVLRMLIEKQLPLTLSGLLEQAVALFADNPAFTDPSVALTSFIYDRLRGILKERGFSPAEVEAVVAPQPDLLANIMLRLTAVQSFAALPESAALAAANKRITNILKKTEQVSFQVQTSLLQEDAERALFQATEDVSIKVQNAFAAGDFNNALQILATIRPQVDAFFNDVMVMAEDPALRANRIALLAMLHAILNQVADISKLAA